MSILKKGRKFISSGFSFAKKTAALIIFILASVYAYSQNSGGSVITIESAQSTQYKKDSETGDDIIVLSGAVSISVTKGSTTTVITADLVNYNRKSEMLYASGNVSLKQTGTGSAGAQDVTADSLLFNTGTLEGVFDNGRAVQTQSDAINLPSGSTLIVSSKIFGRDASSTIAFKNAVLTFCDDENPHWKIKAARIWLLPGGEFAFLGAVLYVGNIPILPLPAFYYPKDELIFNPVFGYNKRKGLYTQNTYYLIGRKPLDSGGSSGSDANVSDSLFNFMKSTKLKEQEREGLVLHNLEDDYSGSSSDYLKIMADYYTNLGGMVGVEASLKPGKVITSIEGGVKIAFSNTIFQNGDDYTPYSNSGKLYADASHFFGINLPFRYGMNLRMSISKPFSLTLSLPVYSDPFFSNEFAERKESMDWIGFMMSSAEGTEEDESSSELSSFTWSLNGSYSVTLPKFLNPFISTLSLSSFSSQVVFSSKQITTSSWNPDSETIFKEIDEMDMSNWKYKTPERKFYYPSQIIPFKISGRIGGTLVQVSSKNNTSTKKTAELPVSLVVPDALNPQTETDGSSTQNSADSKSSESAEQSAEETEVQEPVLPDSAFTFIDIASAKLMTFDKLNYSLTYSGSPEFTSQLNYDSTKILTPDSFDWDTLQSSYIQFKGPSSIKSSLSYRGSFLSLTDSFSFNPVFQKHPTLEGYEEPSKKSSKESLLKADYNAQKLDLTNTNSLDFKPFIYSDRFKGTGISWNTTIKMIQTEFLGDKEDWLDNPEWVYKMPWDFTEDEADDWMSVHTLSGTLSSVKDKYSQVLTVSTKLPPQKEEYSGNLSFTFPNTSLSFATSLLNTADNTSDNSVTEETPDKNGKKKIWELQPLQQSASIKLFTSKTTSTASSTSSSSSTKVKDNTLTITESLNYDWCWLDNTEGKTIDDWKISGFKLSLGWRGLSLAYTMQDTYDYFFIKPGEIPEDTDYDEGWNIRKKADDSDSKSFQPVSLSLSYSTPSNTFRYWKNRISFAPSLSTSITLDMQRPTNSVFRFTPSITFKINNFLDLTFSSDSKNSQIFKYFNDLSPKYKGIYGEHPNFLVDLLNSFGLFYDGKLWAGESARKASAYKLQSLSMKITHNLCDWNFAASVSVKPRTITEDGKRKYSFKPYITVSVIWAPLPAMKTEIQDEYGEWKLNP